MYGLRSYKSVDVERAARIVHSLVRCHHDDAAVGSLDGTADPLHGTGGQSIHGHDAGGPDLFTEFLETVAPRYDRTK